MPSEVKVFFDDSPDEAMAALLEMPDAELSEATLERSSVGRSVAGS